MLVVYDGEEDRSVTAATSHLCLPEVFVQVFADPGRYLEDPQEDEECAQEDGQTFQHDLGHCSSAGFGTCNKV